MHPARQVQNSYRLDAEYDYDRAISKAETLQREMRQFRGDITSDAIDDFINGLTDLISDLRAARSNASADAWGMVG